MKKTIKNIVLLVTLLIIAVFGFLSFITPSNIRADDLVTHEFKFYFDPSLVPDMDFAKTNLPKYINDMNYILAKNTNSRFTFDPETDIILTSSKPQSDSYMGTLPTEGYEVWAYIVPLAVPGYPYSYGGTMSFDQSGAAVLTGLHWTEIYNPDTITPNNDETHDYWIQIDHMLHEYAHVFNAGMGEYYNLSTITDHTEVDPILNISVNNTSDKYWSDKTDFFSDPLLKLGYDNALIGNPVSRSALLAAVKYSNLTAAIINGNYRCSTTLPPTVDLGNLSVQAIDSQSQTPISGAEVKIWKVGGYTGNPVLLLSDTTANSNGIVTFAWGGTGDQHNNYDFLRLIKISKDGYESAAKYISIFDTDIQKIVLGQSTYSTTIDLVNLNPTVNSTPTPTPILSLLTPSFPGTCDNTIIAPPNLFEIEVTDKTAKLFFTPINGINNYYISYSTNSNAEEYGTQIELNSYGVQNFTVNLLNPSTTYYFKVRGQNGCMPGVWSNILKTTTNSEGSLNLSTYYENSTNTNVTGSNLPKTGTVWTTIAGIGLGILVIIGSILLVL